MLNLYNTLTRKKEEFKPIKPKQAGLYTCGPTVYNFAHIGNLRTYIFEDILERTLQYVGYKVNRVMNITDVGHLTGDSDEGRDKVEEEAKKENKSVKEITDYYTKVFLDDLHALNIKIPKSLKPATKFIKEEQALVSELMKKGFAYETDQAVYFDVSKFPNYGKLSGQSLRDKVVAARGEVVSDPQKKNPADFALWFKRVGKFKNHIQHWNSPWGDGFPGWHVECSAISRKFLGQPFDIHTGGVDHIGTHHTNEIAQSEAAYDVPLANYWMHGEFLLIDNSKMAKSEGNFFTMADLVKNGSNPLAFRYLVLQTHYRQKLNFSWDSLKAAENALKNIYREAGLIIFKGNGETSGGIASNAAREFLEAIEDDLNAPRALAVLADVLKSKGYTTKERLALVKKFDEVLGLEIIETAKKSLKIPSKVTKLANEREQCRANKQFMQSDALRKEINELGFEIEDTSAGPFLWPAEILNSKSEALNNDRNSKQKSI